MAIRYRNENSAKNDEIQSAIAESQKKELIYRQRIKGLEEQIATLREQLNLQSNRRQDIAGKFFKSEASSSALHRALDRSLSNVRNDPTIDSLLLEAEASRLRAVLKTPSPRSPRF